MTEEQAVDLSQRCAVLYLDAQLLLAAVATRGWFQLQATGLPADAQFVALSADWERQAVGILIRHPSFPETPLGEPFPRLGAMTINFLETQKTNGQRCAFPDCDRPAELTAPSLQPDAYCAGHYKAIHAHDDPPVDQAERVAP